MQKLRALSGIIPKLRKQLSRISLRLATLQWQILPLLWVSLPLMSAVGQTEDELLNAIRKSDVASVKSLLAKGVNVNATYRYDRTPLSFACDRGNTEIVKLLLDAGASVNAKDSFYGATPLTWASSKGYVEIVGMLLERGATGKDGVLVEAAGEGNTEMARMVLRSGGLEAEILSIALGKAVNHQHMEIVELLKSAGATPQPPADFQVDAGTLNLFAGTYRHESGREMTLSVKEGKLSIGGQSFLGAVDKLTFRLVEDNGITIVFNLDGDRVVSLTVKEVGGSSVYQRVEANP